MRIEEPLDPHRLQHSLETMYDQVRMLWELHDTTTEKLRRLEMVLPQADADLTTRLPETVNVISKRMLQMEEVLETLLKSRLPDDASAASPSLASNSHNVTIETMDLLGERVANLERQLLVAKKSLRAKHHALQDLPLTVEALNERLMELEACLPSGQVRKSCEVS